MKLSRSRAPDASSLAIYCRNTQLCLIKKSGESNRNYSGDERREILNGEEKKKKRKRMWQNKTKLEEEQEMEEEKEKMEKEEEYPEKRLVSKLIWTLSGQHLS